MSDKQSGSHANELDSLGRTSFAIPVEKSMGALYQTLTPEQRNWRCEQSKKSADLLGEAMAVLQPYVSGRKWNAERVYKGLALVVKGAYEAQGYLALTPDMMEVLRKLMRLTQQHMIPVMVNGQQKYGDAQPADMTLRVTVNCLSLLIASTLSPNGNPDDIIELQDKAYLMADNALTKHLGGPLLTENDLSPGDMAWLERLADAEPGELQAVAQQAPVHVLAMFLLNAMYDIDIRVVKWALHFVAARCAKESYARARRTQAPPLVRLAKSSTWLGHCRALAALAPDSPYGHFVTAEARAASGGATPDTLAAMRQAAALAQSRGDDLVAWLAHLSAAQILVYGGAGGKTFSEDEVTQALDSAAAQHESAKRWGGALLSEPRCRAVKDEVKRLMREARERKQQQQQAAKGGAGGGGGGGGAEDDDGRLPCARASLASGGMALEPVALEARGCSACHKKFHKTLQCGGCRSVWYCGRECQTAHWRAGHKNECAAMAAARAAKGGGKSEDQED